jgi:glucose-6-phosphate dehydrogenase assembly protein OpcA
MTAGSPEVVPGAVRDALVSRDEEVPAALPGWEERDTSVAAVESQLSRLWAGPVAQDEAGMPVIHERGLPHARASVLNLIVTVLDAGAADRVMQTLRDLGVRHPSRAIVLVASPSATDTGLDARISTHCEVTGTDGSQLCHEEVILTVRGERARHLSGIVAPLVIHDLPTDVWWPGDPPFGDPVFEQLVEMADRLIIDSADFGDLSGGYRRLSSVRRRSGVIDLAWARLGWWQELTAQFFDAPRFRRYLPNLSRLIIRYAAAERTDSVPRSTTPTADPGGEPDSATRGADAGSVAPGARAPLAQAVLYAGWIATRLGWRRHSCPQPMHDGRFGMRLEGRYEMVDLVVEPVVGAGIPAGDLVSVRLRSLGEAGAAEFIIDRAGDEATVATNADGMTALLRRVTMEPAREAELLSQLLAGDAVNSVYEDALRAAAILLASARGEPRSAAAS